MATPPGSNPGFKDISEYEKYLSPSFFSGIKNKKGDENESSGVKKVLATTRQFFSNIATSQFFSNVGTMMATKGRRLAYFWNTLDIKNMKSGEWVNNAKVLTDLKTRLNQIDKDNTIQELKRQHPDLSLKEILEKQLQNAHPDTKLLVSKAVADLDKIDEFNQKYIKEHSEIEGHDISDFGSMINRLSQAGTAVKVDKHSDAMAFLPKPDAFGIRDDRAMMFPSQARMPPRREDASKAKVPAAPGQKASEPSKAAEKSPAASPKSSKSKPPETPKATPPVVDFNDSNFIDKGGGRKVLAEAISPDHSLPSPAVHSPKHTSSPDPEATQPKPVEPWTAGSGLDTFLSRLPSPDFTVSSEEAAAPPLPPPPPKPAPLASAPASVAPEPAALSDEDWDRIDSRETGLFRKDQKDLDRLVLDYNKAYFDKDQDLDVKWTLLESFIDAKSAEYKEQRRRPAFGDVEAVKNLYKTPRVQPPSSGSSSSSSSSSGS